MILPTLTGVPPRKLLLRLLAEDSRRVGCGIDGDRRGGSDGEEDGDVEDAACTGMDGDGSPV